VTTKIGVVVFPGTNCEHDVVRAVRSVAEGIGAGAGAELVWHGDTSVDRFDVLVLPGGFATATYLRPGALPGSPPVMEAVTRFAADGRCRDRYLQRLPGPHRGRSATGALAEEQGSALSVHDGGVQVCSTDTPLTAAAEVGAVLRLPVNHFEGNYICDAATLDELRAGDRNHPALHREPQTAPSTTSPASCNDGRNVVGLMPHPERACGRADRCHRRSVARARTARRGRQRRGRRIGLRRQPVSVRTSDLAPADAGALEDLGVDPGGPPGAVADGLAFP